MSANLENAAQKIAQAIRAERKSQNMTQTELAHMSGTSLNFISQLELGKPSLRLNKLLDVMITLGLEFKIQYGKKGISH